MATRDPETEALLRAALQEEAATLWPPATLWPRLSAALARPAPPAPAPARRPAALIRLMRRHDTRSVVLALLAGGELDGFALARRVEDLARAAGVAAPREGALLPLLHGLEQEGLLVACWRQGPRGPRRAYALSARGLRRRRGRRLLWQWRPRRVKLTAPAPHGASGMVPRVVLEGQN